MTQDEIISMAEQAGWLVIGENIYSPSSVGEDEDLIEEINALVKLAAEHERKMFSNLEPVINLLESGCDPKEAAKELRIYAEAIRSRNEK